MKYRLDIPGDCYFLDLHRPDILDFDRHRQGILGFDFHHRRQGNLEFQVRRPGILGFDFPRPDIPGLDLYPEGIRNFDLVFGILLDTIAQEQAQAQSRLLGVLPFYPGFSTKQPFEGYFRVRFLP